MPSSRADRLGRAVLDDAQPHRVAQRRRQARRCRRGRGRAPRAARRSRRGRGCGQATSWPRRRRRRRRRRATRAAVDAAQRVDDLVLQHRGQPGAQRRAAAEAGAAREHRLDHVVDRVLGEHRVAQPAQREADQVGRCETSSATRSARSARSRAARRQGGGVGGRCRRGDRAAFIRRSVRRAMRHCRARRSRRPRERSRKHHIAVRRWRGDETIRPCRRLDPRRRRPDRHPRPAGDEPAQRRLRGRGGRRRRRRRSPARASAPATCWSST